MDLDNECLSPPEDDSAPEFAAFDSLTRILISVPVRDIRAKLEDVLKTRGGESHQP
jgi:hypothetical protein